MAGTTQREENVGYFIKLADGVTWAQAVAQLDASGVVVAGGAITSIVPGVAATNLGKAEDAAGVSGDTGVFMLGVRDSVQSTPPAGTDGDYSQVTLNPLGHVMMAAGHYPGNAGADGITTIVGLSRRDTTSNSGTPSPTFVHGALFNGTSFDRARGNIDTAALITAAAVTSGQSGADQTNFNSRGVVAVIDMTNVGTGSVTLNIQGKDAASGKYYTIISSAAVVTNITVALAVYAGASAVANSLIGTPLPRIWRVTTTANNANAATYTVGASVIV